MNAANQSEAIRLLILRTQGSELLLVRNAHGLSLPSTEIPLYERSAPHVSRLVTERWNLETVCLFGTQAFLPARCQLVEAIRQNGELPRDCSWLPVESLTENIFAEAKEFSKLRLAMAELRNYESGALPAAFAKPGWIREVFDWVGREITPLGLRTTGAFDQLNAAPTFSLLRIETSGPALWFKAVGEPNLREYPITLLLAERFSAFLPQIVAHRREWNAWLSIEAKGVHPDANSDSDVWLAIAAALAELQIASLGHGLHLIEAGCRDRRACSLASDIDPFLEVMAELMYQQAENAPARLTRTELQTLGKQLLEALSVTSESEIPNTLGSLDVSPGNVILDRDSCVFLDWSEAFVGQPFLTLQYLLEHRRSLSQADTAWEKPFVARYLEKWNEFFDPQKITDAFAVAPLVAAFTFATTAYRWREATERHHPSTARMLRSLTRRMNTEAKLLAAARTPCNA